MEIPMSFEREVTDNRFSRRIIVPITKLFLVFLFTA
jgi:hypothetical protein